MLKKLFRTSIVFCTLMPFSVFADNLVTDVGNGAANVVEGTGKAVGTVVEDTGKAVGTVVHETGKGVSDVIHGGSSNKSKTVPDATVTKDVKAKIKSLTDSKKIDSGNELQVSTNKGVVTIEGSVTKEDDIATIKQAVNSVPGVKSLTVNIKVSNAKPAQ